MSKHTWIVAGIALVVGYYIGNQQGQNGTNLLSSL